MTRSGLILDNRYRLDERIAAGGVGQVWRATDLLLARQVAVKVLRPEYSDHPETLERFRKEARHAGALNHPHVAQVYDYGPSGPDGSPYLVMEYVDGQSLADALVVDPIEPIRALDIVSQAADGLAAAHRAGLVHRDIKPGNILIGKEGWVKVTDFGIAHAAGQAPVTAPGLVMGTTQYMAPERIAGSHGTGASDVYALGIVLHECLTGMPPHDGTPAEVMAAHLYLPLPPLPADTPPEVDNLVARLTAKDPAQRISDARQVSDLAAILRDSLSGVPHVAQVRTGAYLGSKDSGPQAGEFALEPAPALAGGDAHGPAAYDFDAFGTAQTSDDGPPAAVTPSNGLGGRPAYFSGGWTAPPTMPPPGGPSQEGQPRRRRATPIAVGAAAAVSAALIALFVSGAFNGAPTANQGSGTATVSPAPGQTTVPAAGRTPQPTSGVSKPGGTASARPTDQATKPGQKRAARASASSSAKSGSTSSASPTSTPSTAPASSVPIDTPSAQPTTPSSAPSSSSPSGNNTPAPSPVKSVCVLIICV